MKMMLAVAVIALAACGAEEPGEAYTALPTPSGSGRAVATAALERLPDAAGINFIHVTGARGDKWMPETMGAGVAVFDYDGDGWNDVVFTSGTEWDTAARSTSGLALFRNRGDGTFSDVTTDAGLDLPLYGMGVSVADYDADGDDDLYVTAVGSNRLFRNDRGRYTDVTIATGVDGNDPSGLFPPAWSTAAAWLDVDRDGWLDLFVCNYVRWTPETDLFTTLDGTTKSYATPQQYEGESCRLYRSLRGRRFEDVTEPYGVLNHEGKSLGIAVEDVNDDGWMDVIVANDTFRNFLYVGGPDGFSDQALPAGIALDEFGRARAGMGIDVVDVMGDGRLSIAIGNFSREAVSLYTLVGDLVFQDMAGRARLNRPTTQPLTFGVAAVDIDLDGDRDLVMANGHIEPEISAVQQDITFEQSPQLFLNDGAGRFTESAAFGEPMVARGIAVGDLNGDRAPDIVMATNGGNPVVWMNRATGPTVALKLSGAHPNLNAVGAVVSAYTGTSAQRWMVRTGSSYLSQSDHRNVIFGLGTAGALDSLTVRWPTSGEVVTFGAVEPGSYLIDEENNSLTEREAAGS